jgi:two-component system, OmpR family, alkaline phosphatase synthesis response regulator PhoP
LFLRFGVQTEQPCATELKLLAAFARNGGRMLTRDRVLDEVLGSGVYVSDRVVGHHIVSLRKKIEDEPSAPAT